MHIYVFLQVLSLMTLSTCEWEESITSMCPGTPESLAWICALRGVIECDLDGRFSLSKFYK